GGRLQLTNAVNAVDPLHPTAAEDANSAPGVILTAGTAVTWTYLLTNTGTSAVTVTSLRDDNGTPTNSADDFSPAYVSGGDANGNGLLDVGETWLYTSAGAKYVSTGQPVPTYAVKTGQYGSTAALSAAVPGTTLTAAGSDKNYLWGQATGEGPAPLFWQSN